MFNCTLESGTKFFRIIVIFVVFVVDVIVVAAAAACRFRHHCHSAAEIDGAQGGSPYTTLHFCGRTPLLRQH